jgi:hypothetical protein
LLEAAKSWMQSSLSFDFDNNFGPIFVFPEILFQIMHFQSRMASGMPALTIRIFADTVVDSVRSTGIVDILSVGDTWKVVTCSEAL